MFIGVSSSVWAMLCEWEDLMRTLTKLAYSPNLGTSICCFMAGLQMLRNEQKLNLG